MSEFLCTAIFFFGIGLLFAQIWKALFQKKEIVPPPEQNDFAATWRTAQKMREARLLDDNEYDNLLDTLHNLATGEKARSTLKPKVESATTASRDDSPPVAATPATSSGSEPIILAELRADSAEPPAPVHPLDAPDPPEPPEPAIPAEPRRPFSDVMAAFMEDKNIRWGELISGVLIVGCSIALVLSLRQEIRRLSQHEYFFYLPALMFMLVTAAIHGAGNYTLRRWKLTSTSRGVLIIATLLIPINFMAAIMVTGEESRELSIFHPLLISAMLIGFASFGTMAYYSGRALMSEGWWRLWIGVLGTSAGQLIINRAFHDNATPFFIYLLMTVPLAAFFIATISQLSIVTRVHRVGFRVATDTLLLLGVSIFSLGATIGLLLSRSESIRMALIWLSAPLCLTAVVVLATGLAFHQRIVSRRMAALKTTGTTLTIIGGVSMLVAVGLAWPEPQLLVTVGLIGFISLTIVAIAGGQPSLHTAAIASGTLAFVVGFHLLQGAFNDIPAGTLTLRLFDLALMGRTSFALAILSSVVAGCGIGLLTQKQQPTGLYYLISAGGVGLISILVAVIVGFTGTSLQEPHFSTPVLGFYAIAILTAGYLVGGRAEQDETRTSVTSLANTAVVLTWIGSSLLLITLVHGLAFNVVVQQWLATIHLKPQRPGIVATLLHAVIAVSAAAMIVFRTRYNQPSRLPLFASTLLQSSLISACIATPFALVVLGSQFGPHAMYVLIISIVWLVAAIALRSNYTLATFHSFATIGIVYGVTAICQQQSWWTGGLLLSQHLQAQFGTLAAWCLLWSAGRRLSWRWPAVREFLRSDWGTIDDLVLGVCVLGMLASAAVGSWFGVVTELGIVDVDQTNFATGRHVPFSLGSAIAIALILAATISSLVERFTLNAFSYLFITAATACLLIANTFYDTNAVASAARWLFTLFAIVATTAVCFRSSIANVIDKQAWLHWTSRPANLDKLSRAWTLWICGATILGLTAASAIQVMAGNLKGGASANSIFTRVGVEVSFGAPLIVLIGIFIVHALRERRSDLMFAGSIVFALIVNSELFHLLFNHFDNVPYWPTVIGCTQLNIIGLGLYAIGWMALGRWLEPTGTGPADSDSGDDWLTEIIASNGWLATQVGAVIVFLIALVGLALSHVVIHPGNLAPVAHLGRYLSYASLVVAMIVIVWYTRRFNGRFDGHVLIGGLFALTGPLAVTIHTLSAAPGQWVGLHALMVQWAIIAAVAFYLSANGLPWLRLKADHPALVWWTSTLIALLVFLALGSCANDPQTPWWSFGTLLAAAVLSGASGLHQRSLVFAYISTLLTMSAATVVWWGAWPIDDAQGVIELFQLIMIAAVLSSFVWLYAQLRCQRKHDCNFVRSSGFPAVHRICGFGVTIAFLLLTGLGFATFVHSDFFGTDISNPTGAVLLGLLAVLLLGTIWDKEAKLVIPMLFIWGFILTMISIDEVRVWSNLNSNAVLVVFSLAVAGYIAMTGYLWKQGAVLAVLGVKCGVPDPVSHLKRTAYWLPAVTGTLGILIICFELAVVLSFPERWMRVSAAFAPLLLAFGVACHAQPPRRVSMQTLSLILASIAAIFAAWADLEPSSQATFVLERVVRLMMVFSGLTLLYIFVPKWITRLDSDWQQSVRSLAATCAIAAIVSVVGVLACEVAYFDSQLGTPFGHPYQVVAVGVMLAGLITALLAMALSPKSDPLTLSENGRMLYVYAAQLVGALLFAHVYLSNPQIFGAWRAYWPYIVMGICFLGVGVGEFFQRKSVRVLAEPLQCTGGFLPLLPAVGWWLNETVGIETACDYSLLLFSIGIVYVLLAMLRRSLISALAATVAGNAALWSLLSNYQNLSLLQHPQLWMIPPALSVLIAAQINRKRLSATQLSAIRYVALLIVYVSSASEIFIEGVGDNLWGPMVLTFLSVVGVFVGIGLRIRAFLYLGSTFVFLSVVSMVWHAYANIQHVGIWWAFGILLGIVILTIFGIFEKKRAEITGMIDSIKKWER